MDKSCTLIGVSLMALFAATEAGAQAQPAEAAAGETGRQAGLEEIVVVAQKRAENLQQIPIAITAVTPATMEAAGIESVQNLPAVLPGVQVLNVNGTLIPRVRGVGASFAPAGVESPVATYVDDVYYGNSAELAFDFSDVAQVAALKGPQGTLFGRNATGGVLQISTRRPQYDFNGSVETSLDNYLTSRSNMFFTGPVSENVAASFAVAYTHQGEGYGTNIATGNDTYKIDQAVSGRAKINVRASDRVTLDFSADYAQRKGPLFQNFRTFPGFSSVFAEPNQGEDAWDSNRFLDQKSKYSGGGLALKAAYEFEFATLTSITAYRDSLYRFNFTNIPSPTPTTDIVAGATSSQFTQEVQLVSPSSGKLTWAVGMFYYSSSVDVTFFIDFINPLLSPLERVSFPSTQDAYSVAGFAQATYELFPKTRLTLGLRYTYDKKEFDGRQINTVRGGVPNTAFSEVKKYSFDAPTWRVAVDHDLTDDVLIFASYNRGIKSGGFNTSSPAAPAFDTERLDAFEVGAKSQLFDNNVRLNLAGYFYDYQNMQLSSFRGDSVFVTNAGSSEIYGIDADLEARLSDRLTLTAGVNWLHARFTEYLGPFAVPRPGNQGAISVNRDLSGFALPQSPNLTYTLGVTYEVPSSVGTFRFNVNDNYNSGFYTEADNQLRQPSYHLLGASVGWTSLDERYFARLFANNILNEAVVSQGVAATTAYLADYTNPPFVFGGSFKVGF